MASIAQTSHRTDEQYYEVAAPHSLGERLVIAAPSPLAVDIERAVTQMQGMIERYRGPAPTWVREQNLATAR